MILRPQAAHCDAARRFADREIARGKTWAQDHCLDMPSLVLLGWKLLIELIAPRW